MYYYIIDIFCNFNHKLMKNEKFEKLKNQRKLNELNPIINLY